MRLLIFASSVIPLSAAFHGNKHLLSIFCGRSASGRALTGHHKLDRSISGPLSSAVGANKQQDDFSADDLAGPAVEAQDEDGLSESEVCVRQLLWPFIHISFILGTLDQAVDCT